MDPLEELTAALATANPGPLLLVTGAGISRASGIPTFRGTDPWAVWERDVTELGTLAYFEADPAGSWRWYLGRFAALRGAIPNPAHHACVALERWQTGRGGGFLLVTQNIDGLHRRAGSEALIEVHGTAERVRCSRVGCTLGSPRGSLPRSEVDLLAFERDSIFANVPRCPRCAAPLRQHVLWFDEYYASHEDYRFEQVAAAAERAKVVVFVGTSFSVGVTELVLRAGILREARIFSLDPSGVSPHPSVVTLTAPAERILPPLAAALVGSDTA
ncbi:MAG: RNA polymerase subunit sigma [Polyangiaceae bacterium]|nr:RNA polymerase subunit sigma [Polyangiaceae bacterium]